MYRAYAAKVRDAIPVMKQEVLEFFRCHLTAVDPTTGWAYCERFIPQRHPQ
jgi:hypothetical protein